MLNMFEVLEVKIGPENVSPSLWKLLKTVLKRLVLHRKLDNKPKAVIEAVYERYFSCLLVARYHVMPHLRYVCVLLPLVRPHVRHLYVLLASCHASCKACTHLGLHIAAILKGRKTHILSFDCGFACATAMGCAGFRLLFGIRFLFYNYWLLSNKDQEIEVFHLVSEAYSNTAWGLG